MAKTNNPLFYFGSVGTASTLAGLLLAAYVGYEWFVRGISHEVIAVVAASGVLFGVQLLIFGVLSDMIVTLNREQTRQFQEIARTLHEGAPEMAGAGEDADTGILDETGTELGDETDNEFRDETGNGIDDEPVESDAGADGTVAAERSDSRATDT